MKGSKKITLIKGAGVGPCDGHVFKNVIFIDNGNTGTVGWYGCSGTGFGLIPTKRRMSSHVSPHKMTVVDPDAFSDILSEIAEATGVRPFETMVMRERPMINPKRWKASMSASRADEAETIVLEVLGYPYMYVDSKQWQRGLLPSSGLKGTTAETLKRESMEAGCRLFPEFLELIKKHGDADGILGAMAFYNIMNEKGGHDNDKEGGNP